MKRAYKSGHNDSSNHNSDNWRKNPVLLFDLTSYDLKSHLTAKFGQADWSVALKDLIITRFCEKKNKLIFKLK